MQIYHKAAIKEGEVKRDLTKYKCLILFCDFIVWVD